MRDGSGTPRPREPAREVIAAVAQLIPRERYDGATAEPGWEYGLMRGTPYVIRRRLLLSPLGLPCTPPPFGALVAISLDTRRKLWDVPLGATRDLFASRIYLPLAFRLGDAQPRRAHRDRRGPCLHRRRARRLPARFRRRDRARALARASPRRRPGDADDLPPGRHGPPVRGGGRRGPRPRGDDAGRPRGRIRASCEERKLGTVGREAAWATERQMG